MTITGIVIAAIGVVAIMCGENFFKLLIQITGGAIALMSLFMLILRVAKRNVDSKLEKTLVIIMFAFALVGGILILCFAEELVHLLAIILGVVILLTAIAMLIITVSYREKGSKLSMVYLILSLLVIIATSIIGYLIISKPEVVGNTMAIILGVIMILLGLLFLFESFMVRKVIKMFNERLLSDGVASDQKVIDVEAEIVDEEKPKDE